MRSISRKPKTVVEEIATKALAPTGNFWNPSRRIGGVAVTVCYMPFAFLQYF